MLFGHLLLMPSLCTCGPIPAEHLNKYFAALLDWDVDIQRVQNRAILESTMMGDLSSDEFSPAKK